jgi:hypothetical protein
VTNDQHSIGCGAQPLDGEPKARRYGLVLAGETGRDLPGLLETLVVDLDFDFASFAAKPHPIAPQFRNVSRKVPVEDAHLIGDAADLVCSRPFGVE